jgi:hypothetical protein
MSLEDRVKSYFQYLINKKSEDMIKLFAPDASVSSPLYGKISPLSFYPQLFEETKEMRVMIKNLFFSRENSRIVAAHFLFDWTLKNGLSVEAVECVDIFEFLPSDQISNLRIIYDTNKARHALEKK